MARARARNAATLVRLRQDSEQNRREALRIAAGFRGEEAFNAGVAEDETLDAVLPWLSRARCQELAVECLELYCWDRLGSEN